MAASNKQRTFVVGVGMTKFERPLTKKWDYPDMGREAGLMALNDAGIPYHQVQAVVASYCYGEPTSGQRAVYEIGMTGVPVFNVNNNCSSASSALMLARTLVQAGMDCVMALGFEKMERGLSERYPEKTSPVKKHIDHMTQNLGAEPGIVKEGLNAMTSDVIKMFAYAAREYTEANPQTKFEDFVKIAYKNRKQGSLNPKTTFYGRPYDAKMIASKKTMLCDPITLGMSASTADGGASAIVCSEAYVRRHRLEHKAIEIVAQHMVTDLPNSFGRSFKDVCGYSMSKEAARKCYQDSGLSAADVDVLEVHDCFSCNELFMYEAMGLVPEGQGIQLLHGGQWRTNKEGGQVYQLGGKWVVNPSGGLVSKGHPIGATGLGQCTELVWQLRGEAGKRQVEGARTALQHNFGIGGAAVVTMYNKPSDLAANVTARL